MIINSGNLEALRTGFNATFRRGLGQAETSYGRIATTVSSTTKESKYGWLGKMPNMREWLGERVVHGIAEHDYAIKNVPYELTLGVDRDDIEDDNLGVYTPLFTEMGASVAAHPDQLVWGALKNGFDAPCYDGQAFFDTDHPVIGEDGRFVTASNNGGGAGAAWYLLNTKRALKPIIHQERRKAQFVSLDNPRDPNVFQKKEFLYGTDGRWNVGYAFWQMAYGSKQALTAANYSSARSAMMSLKGDYGRPLGLVPDLLVVPPQLEDAARRLLNSDAGAGGETNPWKGTAELMVVPWLA